MEESRKYTPESSAHTSHSLQTNFNKSAENRGSSNTMRIVPSDKSTHALHTSRSIIAPSPPGQVSATVPTTIQYQLPTSEVKASSISSGLPSGHLARDSSLSTFPRVERPQFKSDGGPNGSTYASQGKGNINVNIIYPLNILKTAVQCRSKLYDFKICVAHLVFRFINQRKLN